MKTSISIVVPIFNEEGNLIELVGRTVAACDLLDRPYEIVLIDDGSTDQSPRIIEECAANHGGRVKGILLNRNYGQHNAVLCGLSHAQGEAVVTLDGDLQNPPEEIGRLIEKLDEGFDVVGSTRVDRQDSFFRRQASNLINAMVRRSTGVSMSDYGCMLRGYSRRVVNAMIHCHERTTFVPVLANGFASRTTEIEVRHAERRSGSSKYGLGDLVHLMFDLMTTTTTGPLRLMTLIGALMAAAGIGFGVLLLLLRLAYGAEWAGSGVFTLFSVLF
jgi:undecaprenyl-phosphate 4-deoxy-4-formamido-L-arabinose transferase